MSPEFATHLKKTEQVVICEKQITFKTKKRRKFADKGEILDAPERVRDFLAGLYEAEPYEKLYAIAVDSQNRFLGMLCVADGTVCKAPVFPRKLFTFLLLETNATGVILTHNHPGGALQASAEDVSLTRRLIELLKSLDINLLDHMIYAEGEWLSMREEAFFT